MGRSVAGLDQDPRRRAGEVVPSARPLGLQPSFGFNTLMIQTTSRLSRGARLRRGVPIWVYAGMALGGLAAALLFVLLRH